MNNNHIYQGLCPDDINPGSRDSQCPACQILETNTNNASWLILAHTICTNCGIENGNIADRLEKLRIVLDTTFAFSMRAITMESRRRTRNDMIKSISTFLIEQPEIAPEVVARFKERFNDDTD